MAAMRRIAGISCRRIEFAAGHKSAPADNADIVLRGVLAVNLGQQHIGLDEGEGHPNP
jgi:hypothetical protein